MKASPLEVTAYALVMGAALLRVCLPILWPQGLVLCLVAAAVAFAGGVAAFLTALVAGPPRWFSS